MKPPVEITDFQRLDLRAGTVTAVHPHPALNDLSILTVHLDQPVEALAPASATNAVSPGAKVVIAVGLHPLQALQALQAGGQRFTAALVAGPLAAPASEIPDGSRLS